MRQLQLREFVGGLGFAEAPRWHDESLWVSDMVRQEVLRIDAEGVVHRVLRTPGDASGLGWMPDGSLLVVQMDEHEIWRWHDGRLARYSDTSPMSRCKLNDMVVDRNGRAWVGNFGFDYEHEPPRATNLVCVDPGGHAWIAAEGLWFPNGMAIDALGHLLVVGQSASPEVLQFEIGERGVLGKRSVYGTLPEGAACDGLCMDAEQALWIASPSTHEFLRMTPGGLITHRVGTGERYAIACVLGGAERRTLFCLTSPTLSLREARRIGNARIGTVTVDVPGAGIP